MIDQFLIEGVDQLGKSTLIKNILNQLGYFTVIHHQRPQYLEYYGGDAQIAAQRYQNEVFNAMFQLLDSGARLIFDRAHLGEAVYAPRYRNYSGDYIFAHEENRDLSKCRLILLTTSDFSFIQDDGKSLDFSKKEEEQNDFIDAFNRSKIKDKVLVDISNGQGFYKSEYEILNEVLKQKR